MGCEFIIFFIYTLRPDLLLYTHAYAAPNPPGRVQTWDLPFGKCKSAEGRAHGGWNPLVREFGSCESKMSKDGIELSTYPKSPA
jgi:hypothetical protein